MYKSKLFSLLSVFLLLIGLSGCSTKTKDTTKTSSILSMENTSTDNKQAAEYQIFLYGEQHGVKAIYDKELGLWNDYYQNEELRHLFIEMPYYTAEFLNLWMQAEDDTILEELYQDWEGTLSHVPEIKEFYQQIKLNCPETIFHGTDVGHQYDTNGERFIQNLESNGLKDTEQYLLTEEVIEQGKTYYNSDEKSADVYRENIMTQNFIREFDSLNGQKIMGIYGAAHTPLDSLIYTTETVPCMGTQLEEHYGPIIYSEDISWYRSAMTPLRVDAIEIAGKSYEASYFGQQELTGFRDYSYREYWRLENSYDDFKNNPKSGDSLPQNNYPMLIELGQVFVVKYTKIDGSVMCLYYRSDGAVYENIPATTGFEVE